MDNQDNVTDPAQPTAPVDNQASPGAEAANPMPPVPTAGAADPAPYDTPEFSAAVNAAVAAYLDENLAELVAAALPETPEQKAKREADDRAEKARIAEEARQAELAEKQRVAEEEAADAAKARAKAKKAAQKAFDADAKNNGKRGDGPVDYTEFFKDAEEKWAIFADDGATYCPDFVRPVAIEREANVQKDRGVTITVPVQVSGDFERFNFQRLTLKNDNGTVLRCELVSPFWAGEGRKADFPANSLLFRLI